MTHSREFTSWLAPYFDRFVTFKQTSGAGYRSQRDLLFAFDQYVGIHAPKPPLQRETLIQYMISLERLTPRGRDNAVGVVWSAVTYALRHGARVEALPMRPPTPCKDLRQRQPRIVSTVEVESILTAARRLPPRESLRSATTLTLIGLLYTTGIRIGEALALDVGDLDRCDQVLTVRRGKFGKSRALPLRESTVKALVRYVDHPLRPLDTQRSAPLFVSGRRRRLAYPTALVAVHQVCRTAEIPEPHPRPHDFRHTFAVSHVAQWYAQGRDVQAMLPALSTYLGHVSIENTRMYLIANGILLERAAVRFERQTSALDEVLS